jgi:hypothetical protein
MIFPRACPDSLSWCARGAGNQHSLPALEPATVKQRLPCGQSGHRHRRRLLMAHARGPLRDQRGRGGCELRVPAARRDAKHLFPERPELVRQPSLPVPTIGTFVET